MKKETKNNPFRYSLWQLLRDLGAFIKPYRFRFIVATFFRLTSDLVWLYPAYALGAVVTMLAHYTHGASLRSLYIIFILLAAATFWRLTGQQSAKDITYQISERVALDAHYKTIQHLFSLDLVWHERENAGNKLKRIQKGADGLDKVLRMWIDNFIEIAVNLIGMVFIVGTFDIVIAIILFIFLASFFVISFSLTRRTSRASNLVNIKEEELGGLTFELMNNIRSIKVLGMSEALLSLLQGKISELFLKIRIRIRNYRVREWVVGVWANIFRLGTIFFIAWGVVNGHYEVGFIVTFYSYFNKIWESVGELSSTTQDFIIAKYGIARMQEILNEPIKIDSEKGKVAFPKEWKECTLENVSFSYGSRQALRDISFTVKRGEKIGVVGLSGAGKSTLFKLLLKENENYSGDIRFDGVSLKGIKKKSYLEQVAVVLQDTEVFNFSLRDNITIADFKHTDDARRLKTALQVAHVEDFIAKLPTGLDTYIGEKGIKLSGGEKQRLGIARAIFKKPQILFLDEATSHLDLESESKIQDSLHQFFQSVTAVVIAHRLTTIREMDRIIVIENGAMVEQGNFDELRALHGRFYEFWERQGL